MKEGPTKSQGPKKRSPGPPPPDPPPPKAEEESCDNCRFQMWHECHKRAPITRDFGQNSIWPPADSWCGEWEGK